MTPSLEDIQFRVRVIREAYSLPDEPAKDFATRLGIGFTTWNNWERLQRIGLDGAFTLIEKIPALTLDYIYYGDEGSVPFTAQLELRAAEARLRTTEKGRPGGPSKKPATTSRAKSKTRKA